MKNPYESETGCCPRFDPEPWEDKEIQWDQKQFIKDKVFCLFNIPLTFGGAMIRCMKKVEKADAFTPAPPIVLSEHTSMWNIDLYLEVTKEIPDAENVMLSGTYVTKVFEGPYKNAGTWCKQMRQWVSAKSKTVKKMFMYYTTCPKCAKHYGKNYVVYFAEV